MAVNPDIAVLRRDVDALTEDVTEVKADIKELLETWRAARGFLSFVKMAAGVVIALAAAWAVVKSLWH